jgi:peptidoglycan/LPS O-acetylase OafA/YrhL
VLVVPAQAQAIAANRFVALDALRFFAAFAVMAYHFAYGAGRTTTLDAPWSQAVLMHGYLGVHLFFIISGFAILWSAAGRAAPAFARARLLRLYPEFWIAVVVSSIVFFVFPPGERHPLPISETMRNLTMVPQYLGASFVDEVYWTLGVELKFYAITWLLLVSGQLPHVERWLIGWIVGTGVVTVVDLGPVFRSALIFPYGALFAAGGLFFLSYERGWTPLRVGALLLALGISAFHGVGGMPGFVEASDITSASRAATAAVFVGMFGTLAMLVQTQPLAGAATVCTLLGSLTYPLYLLHNTGKAMFLLPGDAAPAGAAELAMATLYSLAVAYAVMRVGTGPVRSLLKRALDRLPIFRPRERRPTAATGDHPALR